jgi:hypothetical protein
MVVLRVLFPVSYTIVQRDASGSDIAWHLSIFKSSRRKHGWTLSVVPNSEGEETKARLLRQHSRMPASTLHGSDRPLIERILSAKATCSRIAVSPDVRSFVDAVDGGSGRINTCTELVCQNCNAVNCDDRSKASSHVDTGALHCITSGTVHAFDKFKQCAR